MFKADENNEYQSVFSFPQIGACDFMKTIYKKHFYEEISKYSNLPDPDTCPIPKSQYEIKQYPFDLKKLEHLKKLAKPGSYLVKFYIVKDDAPVCGALIYGRVTERS